MDIQSQVQEKQGRLNLVKTALLSKVSPPRLEKANILVETWWHSKDAKGHVTQQHRTVAVDPAEMSTQELKDFGGKLKAGYHNSMLTRLNNELIKR